jgi:hypothetical protein
MIEIDKADLLLLRLCKNGVGEPLFVILKHYSVCQAQTPDTPNLSAHSLRDRLNRLDILGLVKLDRTSQRSRVFCSITSSGKKALEESGRERPASIGGDSP